MNISRSALLAEYERASQDWPFISQIEAQYGLPSGLLFAVGSRETNLTNESPGSGNGVWQLDSGSHQIPNPFPVKLQAQTAARMLKSNIAVFHGDLKAGVAAYNAGVGGAQNGIREHNNPDYFTAGRDYAADVLDRMNVIQAHSGVASTGSSSGGGSRTPTPPSFLGPDTEPAIKVTINGQVASEKIGYALTGGSVSLTTNEASQLILVFDDPDFLVLSRFKLESGPDGTPIEYNGIRWRAYSVGVQAGPRGSQTKLVCQPSGVMRMRGFTPSAASNISATDYMAQQAETAGLKFVGEQTSVSPSIGPTKVTDSVTGAKRDEYAWDMGQRLATAHKMAAYESAETYYFGTVPFLEGQTKTWQVVAAGESVGPHWEYGEPLDRFGLITVDDQALGGGQWPKRTFSCQVERGQGMKVRGGDTLWLQGLPRLGGRHNMVISSVGWDLTDTFSPVTIQAADRTMWDNLYASTADKDASAPVLGTPSNPSGAVQAGSKSALDFVTFALNQIGDTYKWAKGRDLSDKNPEQFDCSGLVYWAAGETGFILPSTSQTQWAYCKAHGTEISVAKAANTRGALLFEAGTDGTDDAPGHVAISLGDGQHTIEARGTAYGVNKQPINGRDWSHAALIPGMKYQ